MANISLFRRKNITFAVREYITFAIRKYITVRGSEYIKFGEPKNAPYCYFGWETLQYSCKGARHKKGVIKK